MKFRICISILTVFLTSCGKTYQCPKENLFPTYISYDDTEIDSIILRRFKLGSNFSQKVDSTLLTYNNCQFSRRSDTVTLFVIDIKYRSNDEYEWQLFNPFDQKTVSISDMKFQIEEYHSGGLFSMDPSPCFSPIISYKRDDTTVTTTTQLGNKYLYIHK